MSPLMRLAHLISQTCGGPLARDHPYYTPHPPGCVIGYRRSVGPQRLPRNKVHATAVVLNSTKTYQ